MTSLRMYNLSFTVRGSNDKKMCYENVRISWPGEGWNVQCTPLQNLHHRHFKCEQTLSRENSSVYYFTVDDEAKNAIEDLLQSEARDDDHIVPGTEDVRAFLQAESTTQVQYLFY